MMLGVRVFGPAMVVWLVASSCEPPPHVAEVKPISAARALALNGPGRGAVDHCLGPYRVNAQDAFGNETAVAADAIIELTQDGHAVLFADAACTQPVASMLLVRGTSSVRLFLRDAQEEIIELCASQDGPLGAATLTVMVGLDGPRLEISGAPQFEFGATTVGVSANHLLLVRNTGDGPAEQLRAATSGLAPPFGLAGGVFPGLRGTCGQALAPQESCAVEITYVPRNAGTQTDVLRLAYFDGVDDVVCERPLLGLAVAGREVRRVVTGDEFACALLSNNTVRCWGDNEYGQLGAGDVEPRGDEPGEMGRALLPLNLGTGRTVVQLECGWGDCCAVLDNFRVKCWGQNGYGGLGLGDTEPRGDAPGEMGDNLPFVDLGTDRRVTWVAAGNGAYCALLDDHALKCWGQNVYGGLGLGDTEPRGDAPGEMGNDLPAVDLGTGRVAVQVVGNEYGFCAILDNQKVKCWGGNTAGELGQGDRDSRGDEPGEMGDDLPVVDLGVGRTVQSLAGSTQFHVCALFGNDELKCWGDNERGRLGQGDVLTRGDNPDEMGDNLLPVDLGTGRSAHSVFLATGFSCAVLEDASLKCWGNNDYGTLGLGHSDVRGDQPGEMGDNLPTVSLGTGLWVRSGSAGSLFSCVVLNDGTLKCWGRGDNGRLGLGDTRHRGNDPDEMGDSLPRVDLALTP